MKNAIDWMARNGVAANLLMVFILVVGFISYNTIPQEVFPETSLDTIQISVEYPGATPEEVEEAIVRRVEEQIESVEGIRRITSVASENIGTVSAELQLGVDIPETLDKIKAEVDRIVTFPAEAEQPEVQELTSRSQVITLAVHGNVNEKVLKELANRIKDDLTSYSEMSFIRVSGVRDYEISIEVSEEALRSYGLSLLDVTNAVRLGSLDLPGGSVETQTEEILIRTKGQNYTADDFENIIVLGQPDGTQVLLGDIATVVDSFQDADLVAEFDGQPAGFVEVFRTSDEQVLEIVDAVKEYVDKLEPSLPAGIQLSIWQDNSKILMSRLNLLIKNGFIGLILVILALALFLDIRLAFWVSIGIFISFMGTFTVMSYIGISINLLSLFAFILALGIVVDDAIVIGENIFFEQAKGGDPLEAAINGAVRLARPVIFAVLTTVAAFSPLLLAPGQIGKIIGDIPRIVITVLALSLIESLFILPMHLSHKRKNKGNRNSILSSLMVGVERVQGAVSRQLTRFTNGPLHHAIKFSIRRYGVVIAIATSMIFISFGLVAGGYVKFSFLPDIEGENVIARLELPQGTSAEETLRVARFIQQKGEEAVAEIQGTLNESHPPVVQHVYASIGQQPSLNQGPGAQSGTVLIQSHIAEINFELLDAEIRVPSAASIENKWREKVGSIPNAKTLSFSSALISLGSPVQMELASPDPVILETAVERIKDELAQYEGVFSIEDDQQQGKREIQLALRPQAQSLGVTVDGLARQVRAAFYGAEALRIQRGRDEVRVMVRLPEEERNALADLEDLRIRTATGAQIPLSVVAEASLGYGTSTIQRRDRQRVVTITADVDAETVTGQEVVSSLNESLVPQLLNDYQGLRISFEGEQREQADTLGALGRGFLIAIFVIYALLAIPFKSYTQPLVIMGAIPFGIIGALLGHFMLGIDLGILSVFGIVGLSGVVVNDSLVLIDFVNQKREEGLPMADAILVAGKQRFRPILLTSVTTFLGLFPLILEKSVQAQFLIPMGVSIAFGLLFATFIIMLVVPAMAMLEYDTRSFFSRLFGTSNEHLPHSGDGSGLATGTLSEKGSTV